MLGALIASRIELQDNMIVACSRQLMVIRYGYLVLRCLRVLFLMAGVYGTQYQKLSYGQHPPHPVRYASPGTMQS